MKEYIELYLLWFKLGLFTFGGGYAMLPLIEREVIEKKGWSTQEEILDYYAIGQCTPGIIAVNVATFVGYYRKGILGAICATLGIISPSLVIISLIATLLPQFQDLAIVQHALSGVGIGVCVLMTSSIIKLWKGSIKDKIGICIFVVSLVIAYMIKTSTILVVVLAGICGILVKNVVRSKGDAQC